jgi:hypothetical protein
LHYDSDDGRRLSSYDGAMNTDTRSSDPDPRETEAILMISAPGIRQDCLLAILRTIPGSTEILCADTLEEGKNLLRHKRTKLVILDHTVKPEQPQIAIDEIRQLKPYIWIFQIVAHPRDAFPSKDLRPDSVFCDGFSSADLLEGIQKAKICQSHS